MATLKLMAFSTKESKKGTFFAKGLYIYLKERVCLRKKVWDVNLANLVRLVVRHWVQGWGCGIIFQTLSPVVQKNKRVHQGLLLGEPTQII